MSELNPKEKLAFIRASKNSSVVPYNDIEMQSEWKIVPNLRLPEDSTEKVPSTAKKYQIITPENTFDYQKPDSSGNKPEPCYQENQLREIYLNRQVNHYIERTKIHTYRTIRI